jgi:hypothetical protein
VGAWGIGNFENDDASDWVWELEQASGTEILQSVFDQINTTQYREAPDCSMALAAAEVVAALKGRPSAELPEEAKSWIERIKGAPEPGLVKSAREAVDHVLVDSELQELWEEVEQYGEWQSQLKELMSRLE